MTNRFDIKQFLEYVKYKNEEWTTVIEIEKKFEVDNVLINRRLTRCLPFVEFGDMIEIGDKKFKSFRIRKCYR